ncbi:alpha-amylase [Medicago truncatula]|uniref:Alpha-amylase n=1 Tax=Medicago truncatula TaxID=3880 RepID=G7IGD4_MEDTR|nr:alpha-amylase [Medicago truncatula]
MMPRIVGTVLVVIGSQGGQLSTAYDFTAKGMISRNHVKIEFWRLRDAQGKPPGVIEWWPSRSDTLEF